jgi:hypothetical protein
LTRVLLSPVPYLLGLLLALSLAWNQWSAATRARDAAEALRHTNTILAERVVREAQAAQEWREIHDQFRDTVETFNCGPALDRALDSLRERRARTR